jgi:hypothetical protein
MSSLECEIRIKCDSCSKVIKFSKGVLRLGNEFYHDYECYDKKYSLEGGIF